VLEAGNGEGRWFSGKAGREEIRVVNEEKANKNRGRNVQHSDGEAKDYVGTYHRDAQSSLPLPSVYSNGNHEQCEVGQKLILRNIECCIILHNLLIDDDDEATEREDLPGEWYEQEDDVSDIDARSNDGGDSRGGDDEGDNDSDMAMEFGEAGYSQPFLTQHDSDERRQRCYQYMQNMGLIIT
jgi:hypothetical protein